MLWERSGTMASESISRIWMFLADAETGVGVRHSTRREIREVKARVRMRGDALDEEEDNMIAGAGQPVALRC